MRFATTLQTTAPRLIPATLLASVWNAPLEWVWCALILDYAIKAVLLAERFRRGRWREVDV